MKRVTDDSAGIEYERGVLKKLSHSQARMCKVQHLICITMEIMTQEIFQ